MKKTSLCLMTLCFMLILCCAQADEDHFCDEIPPEVSALESQSSPDAVYLDALVLSGTPDGDYCFLLTQWGMNGYVKKGDAWESNIALSLDNPLCFRRHEAGRALGAAGDAGLTYDNDWGFDILYQTEDGAKYPTLMNIHLTDGEFRLVGWELSDSEEFAIYQEDAWAFYEHSSGQRTGSAQVDLLYQHGFAVSLHFLPSTFVEAKRMEDITQPVLQERYLGWTLSFFASYNMGTGAQASFYRMDDGFLTIRRAHFDAREGSSAYVDTMPVPLSESLLSRMSSEPLNTLIDTSGYGNTFLVTDAFDAAAMPINANIIQNDLQENGLLLLTENDEGKRHFVWITKQLSGTGYVFQTSGEVPKDAVLDLYHFGDNELYLSLNDWDAAVSAVRLPDNTWVTHAYYSDTINYGIVYCGLIDYDIGRSLEGLMIGTLPGLDFFGMDLNALPRSSAEAEQLLNRDNWAVVLNPVATDRLHLRAKAERGAKSLGKFYNRTPVQVLMRKGDWTKVRIGADGGLEGWMMTQYLAFGKKIDEVSSASPDLLLRDEHADATPFSKPDTESEILEYFDSESWIVGVIDDAWFILLDAMGNTGYLPQNWYYEGNG